MRPSISREAASAFLRRASALSRRRRGPATTCLASPARAASDHGISLAGRAPRSAAPHRTTGAGPTVQPAPLWAAAPAAGSTSLPVRLVPEVEFSGIAAHRSYLSFHHEP